VKGAIEGNGPGNGWVKAVVDFIVRAVVPIIVATLIASAIANESVASGLDKIADRVDILFDRLEANERKQDALEFQQQVFARRQRLQNEESAMDAKAIRRSLDDIREQLRFMLTEGL
jgi:hypothetical protein